jgi:hypothetical protein
MSSRRSPVALVQVPALSSRPLLSGLGKPAIDLVGQINEGRDTATGYAVPGSSRRSGAGSSQIILFSRYRDKEERIETFDINIDQRVPPRGRSPSI